MKHILAFDLSSKTGFARWGRGMERPVSGAKAFDASGSEGVREWEMRQWFVRMIGGSWPDGGAVEVVVKEGSAGAMTGKTNIETVELLAYMQRMVAEVCKSHHVPIVTLQISEWRARSLAGIRPPAKWKGPKFANERRKFWKQAALSECARLGWPVASNDAAEALLILRAHRLMTDRHYAVESTPLLSGMPA